MIRRRASPANSPSKSIGSPASYACAAAATNAPSVSASGMSGCGCLRLATTAGGSPPCADSGQARTVIGPSTAWGPISTTASTPSSARVSTQARNATGSRVCRRQYAASSTVSCATARPVRLLTRVIDGGASSNSASAASRSSSAGSTMALW